MANRSQLVTIDEAGLRAFAPKLAALLPRKMRHSPHHWLGKGEETLSYFLVLDAINFGSGFFDHLQPYRGETGYFAVATALRDSFSRNGAPSARALQAITGGAIAALLEQEPQPETKTLFVWFAQALGELGRFIEGDLSGKPGNLLAQSKSNAAAIVDLLWRMKMFRDVSVMAGQDVVLLKRAQIFVHDLAVASAEDKYCDITGLDALTVFADNMLPFALEAFGVLRYHPHLAAQIANGSFQPGESGEVELRANSIWACELLRRELAASGIVTSAREIDFALWNAGCDLRITASKRPHICRTIYY
jgi:hypothetical protein